jgi:hypothetical protein
MAERMKFRVYLDTGAEIEFEADDMVLTKNTLTQRLQEVNWPNVSGNAPRYIDMDHIVAITREIEKEQG